MSMEAQEIGYVLPVDAWAALAALEGMKSFWTLDEEKELDAVKGWAWLLDAELAQETPEHMVVEPALLAVARQMAQTQKVICVRRGQRSASFFNGPDFAVIWESLPGNMVRVTPFPNVLEALGSVENRFFTSSSSPVYALCFSRKGTEWERQISKEELYALYG